MDLILCGSIILVVFIFLVAYGILMIYQHGFHLGRHSAWEAQENLKPTDPAKPKGFYEGAKVPIIPPSPDGPPVYSLKEPFTVPIGPFDQVPQHAETPLGPPEL